MFTERNASEVFWIMFGRNSYVESVEQAYIDISIFVEIGSNVWLQQLIF